MEQDNGDAGQVLQGVAEWKFVFDDDELFDALQEPNYVRNHCDYPDHVVAFLDMHSPCRARPRVLLEYVDAQVDVDENPMHGGKYVCQ